MTAEPGGPVDRLVDLVVFAPLGLALRAREELPRLAGYGRQRFAAQANVARMVGQMAVSQARRRIDDVLSRPGPAGADGTGPAAGSAAGADDRARGDPEGSDTPPPGSAGVPGTEAVRAPGPGEPAPAAADLPIPGYDSLSASQVVQRLPGLSPDELEAVRAYEEAGRNRQTILLRVAQLRAAP